MKTNCAPASQCSESHARSQKCTRDSHITAQFLTREWVCSHLNGTACSHRPKTAAKTKCTLHLQCQERPAQQGSAVLRHHKTSPRSSAEHTSPAVPAAPGLLWASLEAVLGRRCAPAATWSPVGVYKGPGGPHHAAGSAPCGHAALLVPSSHGSANCQPPLKVTVDRLSAQQNSPKSQETQASVCPTRHRFNRAKTRRWHGVMLIHL